MKKSLVCSFSGCDRPTENVGLCLCNAHYLRHLNGKPLDGPIRSYNPGKECAFPGCLDVSDSRGLCQFHYQRQKRGIALDAPRRRSYSPEDTCEAADCDRQAKANGLCRTHYWRSLFNMDLDPPIRTAKLEKGRWPSSGGYIIAAVPQGTPGARRQQGAWVMFEHRFIMQKHLRRPLLKSETVHHKDGNRANNDITNLELKAGAHGQGIVPSDGIIASIDFLLTYGDVDLVEIACLERIRRRAIKKKASK